MGEDDRIDIGKRAGLPSDVAEKMKALERENRELRHSARSDRHTIPRLRGVGHDEALPLR